MKQDFQYVPGNVDLYVKNLEREKIFYTDVLGLDIIDVQSMMVTLGKNDVSLVRLHSVISLDDQKSGDAGLYHFALLFKSRGELARTLRSVLKKRPELFSGSADHLVSEAFYLNDPEGNGIELYFDKDKSQWQWENSRIQMASIYLDPASYLEQHVSLEEPNTSLEMGHFHLKVGSIQQAEHFYVDILGFEITAKYPGALFISVGGYHHHLGLNTWDSEGAGIRGDTLGLKAIEFGVPNRETLQQIKLRLDLHSILYSESTSSLSFSDPWGNAIVVATRA